MNDWINLNLNKIALTPDPPNGINGECVNAASSWSLYQGGPELQGATAFSIFQNFRHPFFDVFQTGILQPGDIVFFYPNSPGAGTGPAGHVDMAVDRITANSFRGVDANWDGNHAVQYVNHSLSGVCGWFRKKGEDMSARNMTKEEAELLYTLAVPGQTVNEDWVTHWTGGDLGQAENALLNDPSIKGYRAGLLNPTVPGSIPLNPGTYVVR